ncbi:MAG: flavoprotein, partial [Opitutus sp.]
MSHGNVLFLLSGSIACYKACTAISRLAQAGVTVQTVATPAALRFVGAPTLEGLSGRPVFSDVFEPGRALDHINLARAADLAIVCPATANTVNRLAAGLADDPIGA